MWGLAGPLPEWPPGGGGIEASFSAAISRRMQVPLRLRLPGASETTSETTSETEGGPAAPQMHLPERLCLAEMMEVASSRRPLFGPHLQRRPRSPEDLALQAAVFGEQQPFLGFASSSSGAQKRKRPGHHSRARKEWGGSPMDGPHLAMEASVRQRRGCSREMTLILESSLEEFGPTDMLALQKQLMRISGRLQVLEEQSMGWRQKQLLFYSILVSACILNLWLWLRR